MNWRVVRTERTFLLWQKSDESATDPLPIAARTRSSKKVGSGMPESTSAAQIDIASDLAARAFSKQVNPRRMDLAKGELVAVRAECCHLLFALTIGEISSFRLPQKLGA